MFHGFVTFQPIALPWLDKQYPFTLNPAQVAMIWVKTGPDDELLGTHMQLVGGAICETSEPIDVVLRKLRTGE